MAVLRNTGLPAINDTDANFRLWAKFIHDVFALGLVDTAATGSIDFTTVTRPLAANTKQGYKVYRFADALQATVPVFIKVVFGSGSATNNPGIWVTIGTTADGAGAVGSTLYGEVQLACTSSAAAPIICQGSAATNRVTFASFLNGASTLPLWFSLERTKDSTGADTSVGLILFYGVVIGGIKVVNYLPFAGAIPASEAGAQMLLSLANPSVFDGDVGVAALVPMGTTPKQPGMNILGCRALDFADYAAPIIPVYGSNHTYIQCGSVLTNFRIGADANVRLLIRYE